MRNAGNKDMAISIELTSMPKTHFSAIRLQQMNVQKLKDSTMQHSS